MLNVSVLTLTAPSLLACRLPFMGEFVGFFQPMFFLVVLQIVLVSASWIWKKVGRKKKDAKQVSFA